MPNPTLTGLVLPEEEAETLRRPSASWDAFLGFLTDGILEAAGA